MIINIMGIPYTVEEVDRIDLDTRLLGQIIYPQQLDRPSKNGVSFNTKEL